MTISPATRRSLPARHLRFGTLAATTVLAAGCASVPNPSPNDPWESYNRSMFAFNETVDDAFLKPVASGYRALTPEPVQTCIGNVFSNLGDVWSALNSFLQARGHDFFNTLGRVLFNSTMGLGGCIDVASMNGARKIHNDLGVTLGVWGLKPGPYVVLPFMGSSSLRDGTAMIGSFAAGVSVTTPLFSIDNVPLRNSILGLYIVNTRAQLFDADKLVDEIALDRYSFIRDAYIQRRKAQVDSRLSPDGQLPDYSDDDLPDYSDDEAATDTTNAAQPK
jgi:phospholipid-binding lipoprotein MlaA